MHEVSLGRMFVYSNKECVAIFLIGNQIVLTQEKDRTILQQQMD